MTGRTRHDPAQARSDVRSNYALRFLGGQLKRTETIENPVFVIRHGTLLSQKFFAITKLN
jgi:hypothetical protein